MGLVPARFHVEWQDLCSEHKRLVIFGPIEHGKTQQLTVGRPMFELGRNPNLRIALISETARMSYKWLARIRANIESNARVQEVFPRLRPATRLGRWEHWQHDSILVERERAFSFREKDYSIEAIGVGAAIMGSRFDIVVCDDTVTPKNGLTQGGRDTIWDWLKGTLLGRVSRNGSVWIFNNAVHELDMPHTLEREESDIWHVVRYSAGDPNCSWIEWPAERIEAKAHELGEPEASRQLFNVPLSESTGLLPIESIKKCQELCEDPEEWWTGGYDPQSFSWITAGLDLGASAQKKSNLTSIAVIGQDYQGLKHLLHLRTGRWIGRELLEQAVDVQRSMKPREWLVESNAAQNHLAALLADRVLVQAVGASAEEASSLNVFGQYTGVAAKRSEASWAIRGMGGDFDAYRWRLPKGRREVAELIREMQTYSFNDHAGDRLMSLWLAECKMAGLGTAAGFQAYSR